jgi:uncharacterized protein
MIDIHMHVGRWDTTRQDFNEDRLLAVMDGWGMERGVLLPLVSPESFFDILTPREVLAIARRHPDRIIPFCNLDPRNNKNSADTDFAWIVEEYRQLGCKGVGELTANIPIDDPRSLNLFSCCGRMDMPVLFHLASGVGGVYGLADDLGLPRLERVLKEFPETRFIGHAMAFWSEIDGRVTEQTRGGYPKGKIEAPGRLWTLFRTYPNLYGDLSAGSGWNAISRDPAMGLRFMEEFQDRLLFGTDVCHVGQEVPIVPYFKSLRREGGLSEAAYRNITEDNARRLLKLP